MFLIIDFLSNYFSVTTVISLLASIVAGVIFIIYNADKLRKLNELLPNIDSEFKADVVKSISEVINLDEVVKDLPASEKAIIVKEILNNKMKRFSLQIKFATVGIFALLILIIFVIYKDPSQSSVDINSIEVVNLTVLDTSDNKVSLDISLLNNMNQACLVKKAELVIEKLWKLKSTCDSCPKSSLDVNAHYDLTILDTDKIGKIIDKSISQLLLPKNATRFVVNVKLSNDNTIYNTTLNLYFNNEKIPLKVKNIFLTKATSLYLPEKVSNEFSYMGNVLIDSLTINQRKRKEMYESNLNNLQFLVSSDLKYSNEKITTLYRNVKSYQ